ncbi:hypothetical protein [Microbispora sp. H10949]|uniref:hypothetical protein n=1 Tax=Microbispora sp. H10949 TaxID=2729111 RepID=UPI001603FB20|nr:hypothetical protein [Microbispora sp. H10949]
MRSSHPADRRSEQEAGRFLRQLDRPPRPLGVADGPADHVADAAARAPGERLPNLRGQVDESYGRPAAGLVGTGFRTAVRTAG